MARNTSKAKQQPAQPVQVAPAPRNPRATMAALNAKPVVAGKTQAVNGMAATMAQLLSSAPAASTAPRGANSAAKLAAMQAAGLAASGATALAHKAGNATLGKLPAGSLAVNPAKATAPSKAGFNATAWAAIIATAPAPTATLANAVQTATACSGSAASAHVNYRVKQGWLQPA
jgi:hypothetical protein